MTDAREDGYIMASALAALFAMSLVAAALVSVSGSALSRVTRMETSVQDRYAVEAAIRLAASQLAIDPRRRTLSFEEGAENLEIGDRSIDVRASWEGMRLDVNRAAPEEIDIATAAFRVEQACDLTVGRIAHSWAGLRSFARDELPVIGHATGVPGFVWFAGQGGYGFQTSPALARIGEALALGQEWPEEFGARAIAPDLFAPARLGA